MAAVHYTAASSRLRHCHYTPRISCISTSFPRKRSLRRNYLRLKILKTLRQPFVPVDSPPLQQVKEPEIQEIQPIEVVQEVGISEATVDASVGISCKHSIFKYGLWLAGAFVFQAVCAVWVFGAADSDSRNGNSNENRRDSIRVESRVKRILNGNVNGQMGTGNGAVHVDEEEIERIRAMAREAREKERLNMKNDGLESEEDNDVDGGKVDRSGIDWEVDNRLIKLRKKLENDRDGIPIASVGHLRKESERTDVVGESELNEIEGNAALLFKKKYKLKDFRSHRGQKPKGFRGSDNKHEKNGKAEEGVEFLRSGNVSNDAANLVGEEKYTELANADSKENDEVYVVQGFKSEGTLELTGPSKNTRKKVEKERVRAKQIKRSAVAKPKEVDGFAPEKSRKPRGDAVKSIESGAVEVVAVTNEPSDVSKGKGVLRNKSAQKFGAKKRGSDSVFWWSNLPYVLGILMYRDNDDTSGQGLYTLKNTPNTDGSLSYIVAFEDSVDATNFCYILQCFFEDLEDFKADVVPLTVNELQEAVKSETMSAIVVKRGELQLYAGQPLADAEMGLRVMIEQVGFGKLSTRDKTSN